VNIFCVGSKNFHGGIFSISKPENKKGLRGALSIYEAEYTPAHLSSGLSNTLNHHPCNSKVSPTIENTRVLSMLPPVHTQLF